MLFKQMNNDMQRTITSIILIFLVVWGFYVPLTMDYLLLFAVSHIMTTEWPRIAKHNIALWLISVVYIFIPFILMIKLNNSQDRIYLFLLFTIVSAFDSGSYIIGKRIGYHKLCPTISPYKTWQGLAGGFGSALSVVYGISKWHSIPFDPPIFLITVCICLLALAGDLFESWLKRRAKIKDTDTILPGHGGLLDRFDSHLFAIYGVYLLFILK